ncbi:hypothetical protein CSUI_008611 [Cystoisospora suis]|uniref:Transmembrane protein n=1 Tax=Cystoisospora suis TaxID=483139 RepID=A0A2C6KM49_9APIC|nr:hypothetical protein CSUI_008611 [Cystoisospora suis]
MVLHLSCLVGAILLWPVATTGLLRGDSDSVSDVSSFRTRSGAHYFRPSVSSGALVPGDELEGDDRLPGNAFAEEDFQKPTLSLLESTAARPRSASDSAATGSTQDPAPVRALRQELSALLLMDFSLSNAFKRFGEDLKDPTNPDRRRLLAKYRARLNTRAPSRENLRKLIDNAKKSVKSLGPGMKAEVDALAARAQELQDTYYDAIFYHLPKE